MKIYTDGACTKNGKAGSIGGFGVYAYCLIEHSEAVNQNKITNNICELLAIKYALMWIKANYIGDVEICTDSVYSIKCVTIWVHAWRKNNWLTSTKNPVKNKELIQNISELFEELNVNQKITFKYVSNNSHKKPPLGCNGTLECPTCDGNCKNEDWVGNYEADRLATNKHIDA